MIDVNINLDKTFEVVLHEEEKEDKDKKDGTQPSVETQQLTREYRYPLTITEKYPAFIKFKAVKVDGLDLTDVDIGRVASTAYDFIKKVNPVGAAVVETVAGAVVGAFTSGDGSDTSEADTELTQQQKAEAVENSEKSKNENKSYENKEGTEPVVGSVMLPLQQSLIFQDGVRYNEANLGISGGVVETALSGRNPFEGITSPSGNITRAFSSLAAAAVARNAAAAGGGGVGKLLGDNAGAILGVSALSNVGEGIGASVKAATRIASNPNQRTLFETVNMRSFTFTFKLIANSAKEAEEIRNIIQFFREEVYPEPITTSTGIPIAYEFPNMFDIEIKNFKGDAPSPKIQRCYLENIQTVYNGTANSMHVDGNFVEVEITLAFREVVAMNKAKVRDGKY